MNRLLIVLAIVISLSAIPTSAGVLRTLGHAGAKISRQTAKMGRDVGRDLLKWIF